MHDFAGGYVHTGYGDGDVDGMDGLLSVSRSDAANEILKLHGTNLVDIPRRAVGYAPNASDRFHSRGHISSGQSDLIP